MLSKDTFLEYYIFPQQRAVETLPMPIAQAHNGNRRPAATNINICGYSSLRHNQQQINTAAEGGGALGGWEVWGAWVKHLGVTRICHHNYTLSSSHVEIIAPLKRQRAIFCIVQRCSPASVQLCILVLTHYPYCFNHFFKPASNH